MQLTDIARQRLAFPASLAPDKERLVLWLPVAFGAGAVTYFNLAEEPEPLWPMALALAGVAVFWITRARPALPLLAIGIVLYAAGWSWSQLHVRGVAAPVLTDEIGPVAVRGRIVDLEPREGTAMRTILDTVRIENLDPDATPERIRITFRSSDQPPRAGDWFGALAVLRPPPPPVAPGGYDFQRRAYFERIGAVGFVLGAAEIAPNTESAGWSGEIAIEQVRRAIAADISAALDGPVAALALALVVGERGTIPDADRDALRDAGLAHLLAISGLHIGIVAGFLFWGVRAALAHVPAIAVRYPIKKWASVAALSSALVYMLIAGATPPTQRAFLMVAVALVAVMIDRNPISMRLVGVAAFGILLLAPGTVLGPSFQLSFAAVIALIAAFEWVQARRVLLVSRPGSPRSRPVLYLAGVCYSTLIATVSTGAFALFHFQQVALYGVAANLIAVPLMAFWVMPMLAVGCIAALFGYGEVGFVPAGWGIAILRELAHAIADWPGAVFRAPIADGWTIALVAVGGLWLCLWRSRLRWLGVGPVLAGMLAMIGARPPDVFVSGTGDPFGIVQDRVVVIPSLRRDRFTTQSWARMAGLDPIAGRDSLPDGAETGATIRCDAIGCVMEKGGRRVALSRAIDALDSDCRLADLVVQLFPGGPSCPAGTPTIRYLDLVIDGAHSIRLEDDGTITRASVGASRGQRPWVATNR